LPFLLLEAMGQSIGSRERKVEVMRDQISPGDPKVTSVMSRPLDGFCDFDVLWDTLLDVLTSQEHSFLDQCRDGKIKESQVVHGSRGEIIVTRLVNGKLFDAELSNELGLNRQLVMDPEELKRFTAGDWQLMERYRVNKEAGKLSIEKYATEPYRLLNTTQIVVHRDPLVFEYWIETPRPHFLNAFLLSGINRELDIIAVRTHMGDPYMLAMLNEKRFMSKQGLVYKAEKSPSDPAMEAYVSVGLDEFFTYDQLWDQLEFCVKRQPWQIGRLVKPTAESNVFRIEVPPQTDTDGRGHVYVTHEKRVEELTVDKERGRTRSVKYEKDGSVRLVDIHQVHRNPLRLEVWSERPPKRRSGKLIQHSAQALLDAVLDRAEIARDVVKQVDKDFLEHVDAADVGRG